LLRLACIGIRSKPSEFHTYKVETGRRRKADFQVFLKEVVCLALLASFVKIDRIDGLLEFILELADSEKLGVSAAQILAFDGRGTS
jgi:hypothetical protein